MKKNKYIIDRLDELIMSHLQDDGRSSFKEIAKNIGVSVMTIHNRYNNLVKENILHVFGVVDCSKLGFNSATCICLEIKPSNLIDDAIKQLMEIEEVTFMALTSGKYNIEFDLVCRDNDHFLSVMHEKINVIKGIIRSNVTTYLEILLESHLTEHKKSWDEKPSTIKVDKKDLEILTHLQKNGRVSFTDIAKEMNVSVGMIRNRYNYLIENQILRVVGWVNPLSKGLDSFAKVLIKINPINLTEEIAQKLIPIKEVAYVSKISGKYGLEINLLCQNNKHLMKVLNEDIYTIKGISEAEITMFHKVLKWERCMVNEPFVLKG